MSLQPEHKSFSDILVDEKTLLSAMDQGAVGIVFFSLDEFIGNTNKTFQKMSGYSKTELLQTIYWETITPPEFRDITRRATAELAEIGETDPYEKQLIRPDGSRWWGLFAPRHISGKGRDIRCIEFVIDITETKNMEASLRASEVRLLFLSEFEEKIRGLKNPGQIMNVATRITGEYLKASRCAYADVEPDGDHFTIRNDYVANDSSSTAGLYSLSAFGTRAVEKLNAGNILVIRNIKNELVSTKGAEMFNGIGIDAIVACPLVKEGRLYAMLAVHQNAPRDWTIEEVSLIESVAERSWSHIERVRSEARLRDSENQFRHLANAMPQVVWTATPGGHLDYINERCFEYSGPVNIMDGKIGCVSILHSDDVAATAEAWKYSIATGNLYDIQQRIFHKDSGTFRWNLTRAVPIRNENGDIIKWYGTNTDIQDQREANEDLQRVKEHLELVIESSTDFAIISLDRNGLVFSWNKGAEHIFGYSAEEMSGENFSIIFAPEDQQYEAAQAELSMAKRSGRAEDERWHLRKNGERFYASGILAAMYDANGILRGFTKIARDVTAQKRAEEDVINARNAAEAASIAKTEFLANMSHEIRTPMNAVIGLSSILSMSQPLTAKQREYIRTLQLSADSLLALINDLLDISKIEARTVELEQIPFNLMQMIEEVISIISITAAEKGLDFTFEGDPIRDKIFVGDPNRLRQILSNLCSNAVKFTEKGKVGVEVVVEKSGGNIWDILVRVRDTGIGIAPENIENIFSKFVQADSSINRKYGGTGLGLAITKTLAEIMGGRIEVQSDVGIGSVFVLTIPLKIAQKSDICSNNESLENVIQGMLTIPLLDTKILLVEDYDPNILVARSFLTEFGYACDIAKNGVDAIEKITKGQYQLILMDVQMHGMNGLETTQAIRAYERAHQLKPVLIIGMTAHALKGDREKCLEAGMDDYISKPFDPKILRNLLKNYLE